LHCQQLLQESNCAQVSRGYERRSNDIPATGTDTLEPVIKVGLGLLGRRGS